MELPAGHKKHKNHKHFGIPQSHVVTIREEDKGNPNISKGKDPKKVLKTRTMGKIRNIDKHL